MEKLVAQDFMHWYHRNPVLRSLLKTSTRAILTAICSPLLLAISPVLVPAAVWAQYSEVNQRRLVLLDASRNATATAAEVEEELTELEAKNLVEQIYEVDGSDTISADYSTDDQRNPTPVDKAAPRGNISPEKESAAPRESISQEKKSLCSIQ